MGMHVHELHAVAVHAPLVLIPAAAGIDLAAAISGDRHRDALGRRLWWLAVGAGAFAGVAGLAASQEVKADEPAVDDMMWLHGAANTGLLLGIVGMAVWRSRRPATPLQAAVGVGALALASYTAYLGGTLVYEHGVGVRGMSRAASTGVRRSPPLLSARAPGAFVRDAAAGLTWLLGRAAGVARRRPPLDGQAFGVASPRRSARRISNASHQKA